ncbi:hypothetical protein [Enhygromyxa salina]|nr:hypothetical protein [Enhygromyxa salina]
MDIEREVVGIARRRLTPTERQLAPRFLTALTSLFTAILVSEADGE